MLPSPRHGGVAHPALAGWSHRCRGRGGPGGLAGAVGEPPLVGGPGSRRPGHGADAGGRHAPGGGPGRPPARQRLFGHGPARTRRGAASLGRLPAQARRHRARLPVVGAGRGQGPRPVRPARIGGPGGPGRGLHEPGAPLRGGGPERRRRRAGAEPRGRLAGSPRHVDRRAGQPDSRPPALRDARLRGHARGRCLAGPSGSRVPPRQRPGRPLPGRDSRNRTAPGPAGRRTGDGRGRGPSSPATSDGSPRRWPTSRPPAPT